MVKSNFFRIKYVVVFFGLMMSYLIIKAIFFATPAKPNYITATASLGNIEKTVLADGSIKAFKQVSVGAQVSGQIKKLYVRLGQVVRKGQMIAEIDDLTQQNNVKQTEASLRSLQALRASKTALLNNSQLTYMRQQKLIREDAGAQADLDLAKSNLDSITSDIEALNADIVRAQIAVDTAKLNLGYTRIKAPLDGMIVAIPVEEGQTVNSVQSAPTIVKIAQLNKMTVEAKISEADVINVKKGMPVYFSVLGRPHYFYRGLTLRDIEPAPDSINTDTNSGVATNTKPTNSAIYYNGIFDVTNPDGLLRISMTAQVYVILCSAKNVLVIPTLAINFDPNDSTIGTVNVINKLGRIKQRDVRIGITSTMESQIVSGLNVGDEVIVSGLSHSNHQTTSQRRLRF